MDCIVNCAHLLDFFLGLVCFKENEFLEFIFLTFPCLATLRKSSQWKLNSSQQKNIVLSKESVFLLIKKGKHFLFFQYTYFHKSRSLSARSLPARSCSLFFFVCSEGKGGRWCNRRRG